MKRLVEQKENYKYTVFFYRDDKEKGSVPASRLGMVQSYTDWALAFGNNTIMIQHPEKPTLKFNIKDNNTVQVIAFDDSGDVISTTNPFCIEGMCINDFYSEEEVEEWDCEHLSSVLVV